MNENTSNDQQIEAALLDTYARHARTVGHPAGRLDDVLRRVTSRRTKRRTLTALTSVAIVVAGVVGIATLGRGNGSGSPFAASASGPDTTLSYWFRCDAQIPVAGGEGYDYCELEAPVDDPVWRCTAPLPPPAHAAADDGRDRFATCQVIGGYAELSGQTTCTPVATAPPTTRPPDAATLPPDAPTTTSLDQACIQTAPATAPPCVSVPAPATTPGGETWYEDCGAPLATVACDHAPMVSDAAGTCYGIPDDSEPGVAPTTIPCPSVPITTPAPAEQADGCLREPLPTIVPPATGPGSAVVSPVEQTYVIAAGDHLAGIAGRFGITLDQLLAYNEWDADHLLLVGQPVKIPPGATLAECVAVDTITEAPC